MRIESISGWDTGMRAPMAQGADGVSQNLQSQIQKKQQEMQKLSENQDMSMEEKMKRRQAIQQEIADLNLQLRQHQIELRREQQQSRGASMDDMLGGNRRASENGNRAGMSQASMSALISADSSMKQAQVQGGVTKQMDGRAGVLKAEIGQDSARGNDTQRKEEELADVEQKAIDAAGGQISSLNDADKALKEAAETDRENEKTDRNETENKRGITDRDKTENKRGITDRDKTEKESGKAQEELPDDESLYISSKL